MKTLPMIATLMGCVVSVAAEPNHDWEITISMASERRQFVLHEPIPIKITWRNNTDREQVFFLVEPELTITMDGTERVVEPYVPGDGLALPILVKPKESHDCFWWLVMERPSGSQPDFLFSKEGKWRVAWPDKSSSVEFSVTGPQDADKRPYSLFSKAAASVFLGADPSVSATSDLTTIATDFPDSTYAPYAMVALTRIEMKGPPDANKQSKIDVWLETVIRTHHDDILGQMALELAISRAELEGDYAKAENLYDKLKAAFPKSSQIDSLREKTYQVMGGLKEPEDENNPVENVFPENKTPDVAPAKKKSDAKPQASGDRD